MVLKITLSKKYFEYHLWENYGQVFYDFSMNQRHALNGHTISADPSDCLCTDRGLYTHKTDSLFKMPLNSISKKLDHISTPYQVAIWFNMKSSEGKIAYRWSPESAWFLFIDQGQKITILYSIGPIHLTNITSSFTQQYQWSLYNIQIFPNNIKVIVNQNVLINENFSPTYLESGISHKCGVGTDTNPHITAIGFLWFYVLIIEEDASQYYQAGTSSNCLTRDSCSCNFAFKLDSLIGCISESSNINLNLRGEICQYSKCTGGLLKSCGCNTLSCFFEVKTECECLE